MKETIRRMRKRSTWVNPSGWEIGKGKLIIMTCGFYLFALISLLKGGIGGCVAFTVLAVLLTFVYIWTERQLNKRFKNIGDKPRIHTNNEDEQPGR